MKNKKEKIEDLSITINCVPFQFIVDDCIKQFFNDNQEYIIKENEIYIFTKMISRSVLKNMFLTYMNITFEKYIHPNIYNSGVINYYIITDTSLPFKNFRKDDCFSKLSELHKKYLLKNIFIKYAFKDRSIKIDELLINSIFDEIFVDFFKNISLLNEHKLIYNNVMFFRHNLLSYNDIYKILCRMFGKNIVNKLFYNKISHIYDLNDVIYKSLDKVKPNTQLTNYVISIIEFMFNSIFFKK